MILDANGKPYVTEAQEGRSLVLTEVMHEGKRSWAVDFKPDVKSFQFEETIMILGDVIRAIAQQARQQILNATATEKVKAEMQKLKEQLQQGESK